ncbi:type II toxin-antitoxin system VapC family toxin [Kovacikia minuta CCNUW1]|uniref:type II toxin-antitoxin system VapC family toxin n=1 Tax=Kovacikia minuta TaxID=2931930 RepID=UPI001CCAED96|nr:type II toxin-antitoxin system VapC family toxin [Kovacikia minuta]UBF24110.1 type II toxin-antitoxin system VapC family toxin [Kovacikia minuta CCNUW1]
MLLDTHTLLWFLNNEFKLPASIKQQIENTEFVFASIASIWEIAIKVNVGKLTLLSPLETIQLNMVALSIQELTISFADVQCYINLPLHHRDPFDRMLIAQAINHSLVIVSADTAFDAYPIQRVWA